MTFPNIFEVFSFRKDGGSSQRGTVQPVSNKKRRKKGSPKASLLVIINRIQEKPNQTLGFPSSTQVGVHETSEIKRQAIKEYG